MFEQWDWLSRQRWVWVAVCVWLLAVALPFPVKKVREMSAAMGRDCSLKQLALALHTYESAHGHFPPAAIYDAQGKPLLSWRVLILPFLEQDELYQQFHLTEAWDSPHNRPLLERMPRTFAGCSGDRAQSTTHFQLIVGPGAAWEPGRMMQLSDFRKGTSDTILIAEAATPVPWTKPAELEWDPKGTLPDCGCTPTAAQFAMADGSVIRIAKPLDPAWLRAAVMRH